MKFVIVGLGRMGRIHLEAALSLGWTCIAAVDPRAPEEAKAMLPSGTPLFDDYVGEIPLLQPEAVVLAATTDVRAKLLLDLLNQDSVRLVVTEKPLSISIAHSREVLATAESLQKRVLVNHQMRFTPLYRYIADLVFGRRYGDLVSMHVSGSNFGLGNNVVHFVEIAAYLFASHPVDVRGEIEQRPLSSHRGEKFKDYSGRLEVRFPGNRLLTVEFMSSLGHGVLTVLNFPYAKVLVNELNGEVTVLARKDSDFSVATNRYGLEGKVETRDFGTVNLLQGTASLYETHQSEDDAIAALRRAVLAVEVAAMAVHSSRKNGGLPVLYETAGELELSNTDFFWA